MSNRPKFSFIIPLFNEEDVFNILVPRLNQLINKIEENCEVILIDDGSMDSTTISMEKLALTDNRYQCIFLSRNFGHQKALLAGLNYARGEFIMILDADLQDPPEMFFEFYDKIKEGYGVVYGIRKNRKENYIKKISYNLFYKILNKISNYPIPKDTGDFCMITKKVSEIITNTQEESLFLRGIRSYIGFKQIGLPYNRDARVAGAPKYTLQKLFKLANDGIFNFSIFPIKMLTYLGVTCIAVSVIYLFITLIRKFMHHDVPVGFTALLFVIILFGGVQLVSIGIIGEYVQRIFFQVKKRPLFIVEKKIIDGIEYR